jgi:hypothetical protein
MDILQLQAGAQLPFDWLNLGFGGLIAMMFFFMVRHLVNSQVKTNEAIAESIRELPTVLLEQKIAYEKGFFMITEKLQRHEEILKEIKDKLKTN